MLKAYQKHIVFVNFLVLSFRHFLMFATFSLVFSFIFSTKIWKTIFRYNKGPILLEAGWANNKKYYWAWCWVDLFSADRKGGALFVSYSLTWPALFFLFLLARASEFLLLGGHMLHNFTYCDEPSSACCKSLVVRYISTRLRGPAQFSFFPLLPPGSCRIISAVVLYPASRYRKKKVLGRHSSTTSPVGRVIFLLASK